MTRLVLGLMFSLSFALVVQAAEAAREKVIARTARGIEDQCRGAAGGDWQRWFDQTEQYRAAMRAVLAEADSRMQSSPFKGIEFSYFKIPGTPSFFAQSFMNTYVCLYKEQNIRSCDDWIKNRNAGRTISTIWDWLKEQNVDLLFVPVPNIGEVYADRLLSSAPADGIITPHLRKALLEMLRSDVEVVDLLPTFLKERGRDDDPGACVHWA